MHSTDILTFVLQAGQPKLKESLHRRLSEQQQAVFYANYGLLLLAAGRLDAAREIVNTYQKRSALYYSLGISRDLHEQGVNAVARRKGCHFGL